MVYHPHIRIMNFRYLHKNPYKQRFIAGSSTYSTKPLSKLLTIILSKIKDGLKRYTDTIYSRNGVNQILILKNSKELLQHLKSKAISKVSSIKTFEFSTLYTTIPHEQLKSGLSGLIKKKFICKNGSRRYKYAVVKYNTAYLLKMKVTHQINIQRLILFEWLNFWLIKTMWNLVVMSIS